MYARGLENLLPAMESPQEGDRNAAVIPHIMFILFYCLNIID